MFASNSFGLEFPRWGGIDQTGSVLLIFGLYSLINSVEWGSIESSNSEDSQSKKD